MIFTDKMKLKEVQDVDEFFEWLAGQIGGKASKESAFDDQCVLYGDTGSYFKLVYVKPIKQFRYDYFINGKMDSYDRVIGDESEIGALIGFMNDRIQVIKDTWIEQKEEEIKQDF